MSRDAPASSPPGVFSSLVVCGEGVASVFQMRKGVRSHRVASWSVPGKSLWLKLRRGDRLVIDDNRGAEEEHS